MTNLQDQKIYSLLEKKMDEVALVAPQNLGFFTPLYKKATAPLKVSPWKILLPVSLLTAILLQLTFGHIATKAVSVLQSSF